MQEPSVSGESSVAECHATSGSRGTLSIQVVALDPLEQLQTAPAKAIVSNDSGSAATLCCPVCRRPFALEFTLIQEPTSTEPADYLQICIRNAHDPSAEWVAPSYSGASVPPHDGSSSAQCRCPSCTRGISLELTQHLAESKRADVDSGGGEFAYATLLYGSGLDYVVGALVLGWTLLKPVLEPGHRTLYRRILLHTDDVPLEYLQLLSHFWELRPVDYLSGSAAMYHNYGNSRFKEVFTKLQALNQLDFDKVLMLDNDLIVRRNIDELFSLPVPAALKRPGGRDQPNHGERFHASILWDWRQLKQDDNPQSSDIDGWRYDMVSGINAGVMLLRPNHVVYQRMLSEIADNAHPEHLNCYGPEQEYLGRFFSTFGPGWTHMDARFNYQALLGRSANRFMRNLDGQREVAIAHFSGPKVKPWVGLVGRHEKLGPQSLRCLLKEDTNAFAARFPENPHLPAAGTGKPGEQGFPTLVVSLVHEWATELRSAARHMQDSFGIELVATVESVVRKEQRQLGKTYRLLSVGRQHLVRKLPVLAAMVIVISFLRVMAAQRFYRGKGKIRELLRR